MNNYIPTWTAERIYLRSFVTLLLCHLNDSSRKEGTEGNNATRMPPLETVTALYQTLSLRSRFDVGIYSGIHLG